MAGYSFARQPILSELSLINPILAIMHALRNVCLPKELSKGGETEYSISWPAFWITLGKLDEYKYHASLLNLVLRHLAKQAFLLRIPIALTTS